MSSPNSSRLQETLANGEFCITAEIVPPLTSDPSALIGRVRHLEDLADAVNVTDGAGAKTTMSSFAAAAILARNDIQPVLQVTCRDRNRIALAGDLLGAAAQGITNLLLMFGDDPTHGDQPDATSVHDLNTIGLISLAREMSVNGTLPSGRTIESPPRFFIGVADTPRAVSRSEEPPSLLAKIDAGAQFVQTQFCFDLSLIERYIAGLTEWGITERAGILIGLGPIASLRSAKWMKENLWGVAIPDSVFQRLSDADDQEAEGRQICIELIEALHDVPGVAGVHLMNTLQSSDSIASIIQECRPCRS